MNISVSVRITTNSQKFNSTFYLHMALNHSRFPIELSASALSSALVAVNCLMYCPSLCRNTIHVQCQAEPLRQDTAGQERHQRKLTNVYLLHYLLFYKV